MDTVGIAKKEGKEQDVAVWCFFKACGLCSVSGWLYDYTQTYDCSFYLAGACYLLSSISLFFEPLARRWKAKREAKALARETDCKTNGTFISEAAHNGLARP